VNQRKFWMGFVLNKSSIGCQKRLVQIDLYFSANHFLLRLTRQRTVETKSFLKVSDILKEQHKSWMARLYVAGIQKVTTLQLQRFRDYFVKRWKPGVSRGYPKETQFKTADKNGNAVPCASYASISFQTLDMQNENSSLKTFRVGKGQQQYFVPHTDLVKHCSFRA